MLRTASQFRAVWINQVPERTKPKAPIEAALAAIMEPIGSCIHWPRRCARDVFVAEEAAFTGAVLLLMLIVLQVIKLARSIERSGQETIWI